MQRGQPIPSVGTASSDIPTGSAPLKKGRFLSTPNAYNVHVAEFLKSDGTILQIGHVCAMKQIGKVLYI